MSKRRRSKHRHAQRPDTARALDRRQREWAKFRQQLSGPCLYEVEALVPMDALMHPRWGALAADVLALAARGATGQGVPQPCLTCREFFTAARAPAVVLAVEMLKPRLNRGFGVALCRNCSWRADLKSRVADALARELDLDQVRQVHALPGGHV